MLNEIGNDRKRNKYLIMTWGYLKQSKRIQTKHNGNCQEVRGGNGELVISGQKVSDKHNE